jgi:hypothetical protein
MLHAFSMARCQIVLSSSSFEDCTTTTTVFTSLSCTAGTTVSSVLVAIPLNSAASNTALVFNLSTDPTHPLFVEPVVMQIGIVTDLVWVYPLEQQAGYYPYRYVYKDRVAGLAPPAGCPYGNTEGTGSECVPDNFCAGTVAEINALYPPAEVHPFRARDAFNAPRDINIGGPRVGYWCDGGTSCEAGFHVDQNFWITPVYLKYIVGGAPIFAYYEVQAVITKDSDPSNPVTLTATSISPFAYNNFVVALHILALFDPTGGAAPSIPGIFLSPKDSPHDQEEQPTINSPPNFVYQNPRATAVYPSYNLPKWFYEDPAQTADYDNGCCTIGLQQSYGATSNALQLGKLSDVCIGIGANRCVPGAAFCSGSLFNGEIWERLSVRYDNFQLDPTPNPGFMPPGWQSSAPNMWLYKNRFYSKPTDNTAKTVSMQIVAAGSFLQQIVSVSSGTLSITSCAVTEGTNSGTITFDITNTGAGNGNFRANMTCTGNAASVPPAFVDVSVLAGASISKTMAVSASASSCDTTAGCTLQLYSIATLSLLLQDSKTASCTIACQFTVAPPFGGGTGAPGTGTSKCSITSPLACLGINLPNIAQYLIIVALICCCCCSCVICVFILISVGPSLLSAGAASSASSGGGGSRPSAGAEFGSELPALRRRYALPLVFKTKV